MIGYTRPVLVAKLPSVKQDFDTIGKTELTTSSSHKPSLDEYDHASYDDAEDYLNTIVLERWGDRRFRHANHD